LAQGLHVMLASAKTVERFKSDLIELVVFALALSSWWR
jgi:hypothetical protein